jgi:uncharacterized protein with NAD-binding domain and iron-sulfur cluster
VSTRTKVAILGGGMGSLATAWKLTESDEMRSQYEVTIYQEDWLLGGKAASTRSNKLTEGRRIHEHGIHLMLGFYNNTLNLIRQAYDEADASIQSGYNLPEFEKVFTPQDDVWIAEQFPGGKWAEPWRVHFPPRTNMPALVDAAEDLFTLLLEGAKRFDDLIDRLRQHSVSTSQDAFQDSHRILGEVERIVQQARKSGSGGLIRSVVSTGLYNALSTLIRAVVRPIVRSVSGALDLLLAEIIRAAWAYCEPRVHDSDVRRTWIAIYLVGTTLRGVLRDRVLPDHLDRIDEYDFRQWLRKHQVVEVPEGLSWNSPPITALYDLAFSRRVGLAAGVTLHAITCMLFGYSKHFAYRMHGGTGEIIFAPLYLALRKRGVRFEFLQKVENVRARKNGRAAEVTTIQLSGPANAKRYVDPLLMVEGSGGEIRYAWPHELSDEFTGDSETRTIEAGKDFDVAVLGIPIGALGGELARELRQHSPRFDAAVKTATTVGTRAIQLWMNRTTPKLGWESDSSSQAAMLISYAPPFNAWVDMSSLLPLEAWDSPSPQSLHYLCDEVREEDGTSEADVRQLAEKWLKNQSRTIWNVFDLTCLYASDGSNPLDFQYFRSNVEGSARYVTVGPGTVPHRVAPGESGFVNLALAGDWVRTSVNAGCLEAAVLGGFGAADAILRGQVRRTN